MGLRDLLINIKTEVYSEIAYHSGTISFYAEDAIDTAKEFGSEIVDLSKEIAEGAVDLCQDGIGLYLDYKAERFERFFENIEMLLTTDPYTQGKKEGYNLAAESYEKIYISTKDEYEKIILQLNKSIAFYDTQIDLIDQIIENQRNIVKELKETQRDEIKRVVKIKQCTPNDLEGFTAFPKNISLLDMISSKKVRQYRKGQLNGYREAERLYQNKLNILKEKYESLVSEKISISNDYKKLYEELLKEQYILTESIVSLKLVN